MRSPTWNGSSLENIDGLPAARAAMLAARMRGKAIGCGWPVTGQRGATRAAGAQASFL